jgi:hypothetical protein
LSVCCRKYRNWFWRFCRLYCTFYSKNLKIPVDKAV